MKIVGFDLECTSLSGMVGHILCCSFVDITNCGRCKPRVQTYRLDDEAYFTGDASDDSRLAVAIRDRLEAADIVIGHNSKMFDMKFLKARLAKAAERPPQIRWHIDTMWTIRTHLRASSKLDNIQKFLNLPEAKSPISWDEWARAAALDPAAMDEVVKHCEKDVRVLADVYWRLLPMVRTLKAG